MWLSLVERLLWEQDAAGSNPVIRTKEERNYDTIFIVAFVFLYPKSLAV